jgi:hypothetical protein
MIQVPPCITCQHFTAGSFEDGRPRCAAFPDGIPQVILSGENDHTSPVRGDHGIQWQAREVKRYEYEHPTRETAAAVLKAAASAT